MKQCFPWILAFTLLTAVSSTLLAEEKTGNETAQLSIEKIIDDCEKQYNEQTYPDADERNKLIDQCIDENTAGLPSTNPE